MSFLQTIDPILGTFMHLDLYNGKDNTGEFDPWRDKGIFMGYSNSSRSYRIIIYILYELKNMCMLFLIIQPYYWE